MEEWATYFEKMIFTYLLRYEVYTVGNYMHGFHFTSTSYELNQLLKIPCNISENGTIHLYNHIYGDPLRRAERFNHFAYLKPIDVNIIEMTNNTIQAVIGGDL